MQKYSKNRGAFFDADHWLLYILITHHNRVRIDWIRDISIHSTEILLVDDLSSPAVCLLGIIAQVDAPFRAQLKEKIASYRSPFSSGRTAFVDHLFETTFGPASVESHFRKLGGYTMHGFLRVVIRHGSVSMMKTLLDIGVYFEKEHWQDQGELLSVALSEGNMDIFYLLLEAGANGSSAVHEFLDSSAHLSDENFSHILKLLVENARSMENPWVHSDPLLAILGSCRALCSYPEAPKILLDRKVFNREYFRNGDRKVPYDASYMFHAISRSNPSVVDLLLRNGAHANVQISDSFRCSDCWLQSCT